MLVRRRARRVRQRGVMADGRVVGRGAGARRARRAREPAAQHAHLEQQELEHEREEAADGMHAM
jgi:hypothetical protein